MTFVPLGKQGVGRVKDHGGRLAAILDQIRAEKQEAVQPREPAQRATPEVAVDRPAGLPVKEGDDRP